MLIIGILHGWVSAQLVTDQGRLAFAWLWGGVGAGLGLAILLALLGLEAWVDDTALEWFQAGMPLVAAALIFHIGWHGCAATALALSVHSRRVCPPPSAPSRRAGVIWR